MYLKVSLAVGVALIPRALVDILDLQKNKIIDKHDYFQLGDKASLNSGQIDKLPVKKKVLDVNFY